MTIEFIPVMGHYTAIVGINDNGKKWYFRTDSAKTKRDLIDKIFMFLRHRKILN